MKPTTTNYTNTEIFILLFYFIFCRGDWGGEQFKQK